MRKLWIAFGLLLLLVVHPISNVAASIQRFPDVPSTKHFAEAVNELAKRRVIGGYPDGMFKPSNPITRGQAAAIIVKMIRLETTNVKEPKFTDVTKANGYYQAIAALAEKGVINGYGDGRFGPNDSITRAQMASILVKAFDLPLYRDPDYGFKDVVHKNSHRDGIYSLYQLGLTTGTSPTTFSPNASITRGQAAKLLKAAEDVKPGIVTLYAKDYQWKRFADVSKATSDIVDIVPGSEMPSQPNLMTKIHLVPKKEGTATLHFSTFADASRPEHKNYRKYYVHVKKVDDEWNISLEETDDIYSTPVQLWLDDARTETNEALTRAKSITLSTAEGKLVNDHVEFKPCTNTTLQYCSTISIDQPGTFIATVRYMDDKEVRYWLTSTEQLDKFYYFVHVTPIKTSEVVKVWEGAQLGQHVLPKGSEQIATVTRDKGTNTFRITPKKAGEFFIDFPESKVAPGSHRIYYGITVRVSTLGPYLHVSAIVSEEDDMVFD
ncbi:S-layer homology domain-containing protein [Sporosarcina sp. PTS2304]|uniref:S-layer homology domain-containing protein n=1 Tax=Sporosarcina sp. PTS2304 TaxID=2283194 RepID=UPI000E0CD4C8|nr:S-layer homology domain-containing protein [Sporosarcina sp. PTS2304]AXI00920.1 S-layer homology domain-containing protein [Sporosarcina sp. PTS2304]